MFTSAQLKSLYLRDLPLVDDKGRPMSDALVDQRAAAVVRAFERKHNLSLSRVLVRVGEQLLGEMSDDPPLPERRFDAHPYEPGAWEGDRLVALKLPLGPVRSSSDVLAVGLKVPGRATPLIWSRDWLQVSPQSRIIQLFPMGATLNLMPFAMTTFGLGLLNSGRSIPNAWHIVYRAGYTEADLADKDADVRHALGLLTAVSLLVPGSLDAYLALGVAGLSASVDGLSNSTSLLQNANALKFQNLIAAYTSEYQAWERSFTARRGFIAGVA